MRDIEEMDRNPLENVCAQPNESDIYYWHGNFRGLGQFGAIPLHFAMIFPETYPEKPPQVILTTKIPHPNVYANKGPEGGYTICLDMLETDQAKFDKEYRGWSSSYTVLSVLLQLQSFLSKEEFLQSLLPGAEKTIMNNARAYRCPECGHTAATPFPAFPSKQEIQELRGKHVFIQPPVPRVRDLQQLRMRNERVVLEPIIKKPESKFKPRENNHNGPTNYYEKHKKEGGSGSAWGKPAHQEAPQPAIPVVPKSQVVIDQDGFKCIKKVAPTANQPHFPIPTTNSNNNNNAKSQPSSTNPPSKPFGSPTKPAQQHIPLFAQKATPPPNSTSGKSNSAGANQSKLTYNMFDVLAEKKPAPQQKKPQQQQQPAPQPQSKPATTTSNADEKAKPPIVPKKTEPKKAPLPAKSVPSPAPAPTKNEQQPKQSFSSLQKVATTATHHAPVTEKSLWNQANDSKKNEGHSLLAVPVKGGFDPSETQQHVVTYPKAGEKSVTSTPGSKSQKEQQAVEQKHAKKPAGGKGGANEKVPFELAPSGNQKKPPVPKPVDATSSFKKKEEAAPIKIDTTYKPTPQKTNTNATEKSAKQQQSTTASSSTQSVIPSKPAVQQRSPLLSLDFETFAYVFPRFLDLRDLARVYATCRELQQFSCQGVVWRQIFTKYYPQSQFKAQALADWKYVFQLEVSNIYQSLQCFHTKLSFQEDILGIPLEFTMNPRLGQVDYIYSSMDLISKEAYLGGLRKTVWKEKFTEWLPIYITHEHFKRALPDIEKTILALCPHYKADKFQPQMVVDVIPKLMNTMIVLLSDHGVHASQKALIGFCWLHRLFIALIEEYPGLQKYVDSIVNDFVSNPAHRVKFHCPNIGNYLPLLSVSSVQYKTVIPLVWSEVLDRSVIWVCRKYPELADVTKACEDNLRLEQSFEAIKVSLKLMMFNCLFLNSFRQKDSIYQIADEYDNFYGFPSVGEANSFQATVKKILQVETWEAYYAMLGLECPKPETLAKMLVQSVHNSKKKKYHNENTDFTKIHASGVSKLLLKGDSYTCNTSIKRIVLEDVWSFPTAAVVFLDASCLLYSFEGKFMEAIDFSNTTSLDGAVVHSGDVIDGRQRSGKHTITIDLVKLSPSVKCFYMTVSAYGRETLKSIRDAQVLFIDPDSSQELCQYHHGDKESGKETCCVMAKMQRESPKGQWKVTAIGHICMGKAGGGYDPMKRSIADNDL